MSATQSVKKVEPFSVSQLDAYAPWCILSRKVLAETLGTNGLAFAMRLYRGIDLRPVPSHWLHGNVSGYLVSDVRSWLGDPRSETEMFRDALPSDMAKETELIRLYARAQAQNGEPLIGATFSKGGKEAYLNYLWAGDSGSE